MKVKVITDSCSDLTQEEGSKLGIVVVPAYVRFGNESFQDGIDLSPSEFYEKLSTSPLHPTTAAPSPGDFARIFDKVAEETDQILSIHITRKHSAMYESAILGREAVSNKKCRIEIMDSQGLTMWQALLAINCARTAEGGGSLEQVIQTAHHTIREVKALALLDTLKYIVKGGRLSNAIITAESMLNVKAYLTLRNGELHPAGLVRNRGKGIKKLLDFATSTGQLEELAIAHSTSDAEITSLVDRLKSALPGIKPRIAMMGPTLGVHTGPGTIAIVTRSSISDHP